MQPAQTFGRRGMATPAPAAPVWPAPRPSAPQSKAQTGEAPQRETRDAKAPRPAIASADRGAMWVLFGFEGRLAPGAFRLVRFASNAIFLGGVWGVLAMIPQMEKSHNIAGMLMLLVVDLALLVGGVWSTAATQIKRWHDRNKSGVWMFVGFLPLVGPWWTLIELWFLPGTPGPNRFGPSPASQAAAIRDAVFEA